MADKLLVAFSLHGATAAYWRGSRIVECRTFADDDAGRAGFRDYLTQFSDVPVHIIASRSAVIDGLVANGFRAGLTPARPTLTRMHALLPLLLNVFGPRTN